MTLGNLSRMRNFASDWGRGILWILSVFALFAVFTSHAYAQTATLVGTVTDPTGAVVANATIKITNLETGLSTNVVSTGDGQFVAPDLAIGHYTITATAAGFKVSQKTGVVLAVGDRLRLDFKLEVGAQAQTVTVEADSIHLQTDTGEVSDVITSRQVEQLETNGRSIYTLIDLTPGASGLQGDDQAPTSVSGNANVSFNGQRMSHNICLMDGGEADDRGGGGTSSSALAGSHRRVPHLDLELQPRIWAFLSGPPCTTVIKSGTKSVPRFRLGVLPQRCSRRSELFPAGKKPRAALQHLWRQHRRPGHFPSPCREPKDFLLLQPGMAQSGPGGIVNQPVPSPSAYGGDFTGTGETPAVPCQDQLSAAGKQNS